MAVFLLDHMEDGNEYNSALDSLKENGNANNVDVVSEVRQAIADIASIRNRYCVCYVANVINPLVENRIGLGNEDDLPFSSLQKHIPQDINDIDIILVTPGGSAEIVDYQVGQLRSRFNTVSFILPYMAMSAGTIFCLSGDELVMDDVAFFGPTDPQVVSKNGLLVPAQSLLTLISKIQERGQAKLGAGEEPDWTDIALLNNIDHKEIGNALRASKLSKELVTRYLKDYKFKDWVNHSGGGGAVTLDERKDRATEIAELLCDNSHWLSDACRITRQRAEEECFLQITYPENTPGLQRAIKRFWALMHIIFENSLIAKIYASRDYFLIRQFQQLTDAKATKNEKDQP